ncbi:hypothetical protein RSAG8_13796, partial [Rhizoctonia solani AG-8 WAC10335]
MGPGPLSTLTSRINVPLIYFLSGMYIVGKEYTYTLITT